MGKDGKMGKPLALVRGGFFVSPNIGTITKV